MFRMTGGTAGALAVVALASSGCYSWVRFDLAPPATAAVGQGQEEPVEWVAAMVDGQRLLSGPRMVEPDVPGPRPRRAEQLGRTRVTRMDRSRVELDDTILDETGVRGHSRDGDSMAAVVIPRAEIRLLEVRKMNKGATYALAGGAAAAGLIAFLVTSGDDGPGDGGGYTPPDQ